MVNFSVVGRNATMGERKMYVEYDTKSKKEYELQNNSKIFPLSQAVVGGETGIDIPMARTKFQIVNDFNEFEDIHTFLEIEWICR